MNSEKIQDFSTIYFYNSHITQGYFDPCIRHMILVLIIVVSLVIDLDTESEALTLERILVVERLNDFEGSCSIIVSYHCELICTQTTVLQNLK